MLKVLKITGMVVVCGLAGLIGVAAVAPRRAVLISISPDLGMVRPRNYCVMNPFRDRGPEKAAERFFAALRRGDESVLNVVRDSQERARLCEREAKWPVKSWRIASRRDQPRVTELVYWVTRGNGYPLTRGEEEAYVSVSRREGDARVVAFSALY